MDTGLLEREEASALSNGAGDPPLPLEDEVLDFGDFLSAEPSPQRVEFAMCGRDAWIDLLPMDAADDEHYQTLGVRFRRLPDGTMQSDGDIDLSARNLYLVSRTVYDYCLWKTQRAKETGELVWYQVRPPEGDKSKPSYRNALAGEVRDKLRKDRRFWAWLVEQCTRVNGQEAAAEGN